MNAPYIRNIIIGSVASVLQMRYKDIVEKLDKPEATQEFVDFAKRLTDAEEYLDEKCKEYSKSKPDFTENGVWYVIQSFNIWHGVYMCVYTRTTIIPS